MAPPLYAATALELIVPDWKDLGLDPDEKDLHLSDTQLFDSLVERMTSLLLVRIVAMLIDDKDKDKKVFEDLSTSTICRTVLMQDQPWSAYAPSVTDEFVAQLVAFVRTILMGYNDTPYHCSEHAFHVCLSTSKLIDMMLLTDAKTFGFRHDAVAQFAMVFAALIHDVEHRGVPNRQLVIENDPLAILYNDESVAEQRSLFIGFDQLLQPQFNYLRDTMFQGFSTPTGMEMYRQFRKIVINLVLNTDIASPARTQIGKSKFKEAFGDTFESMERKLKHLQGSISISDDDILFDDSMSDTATPECSERDLEGDELSHGVASTGSISYGYDLTINNGKDGVIMSGKPGTVPAQVIKRTRSKKGDMASTGSISYGYDLTINNDKDGVIMSGKPGAVPTQVIKRTGSKKGASFGRNLSMPMARRSSLQLLQEDEAVAAKFQRRMSSIAMTETMGRRRSSAGFRKRLGIRRSMDLSGEALEAYQQSKVVDTDLDEPDELKKTVVMETIITAADVAHNLQGWDQMIIWSSRLYMELRKAHMEGRGGDPKTKWFENQSEYIVLFFMNYFLDTPQSLTRCLSTQLAFSKATCCLSLTSWKIRVYLGKRWDGNLQTLLNPTATAGSWMVPRLPKPSFPKALSCLKRLPHLKSRGKR